MPKGELRLTLAQPPSIGHVIEKASHIGAAGGVCPTSKLLDDTQSNVPKSNKYLYATFAYTPKKSLTRSNNKSRNIVISRSMGKQFWACDK
jgi:hypothetical protein